MASPSGEHCWIVMHGRAASAGRYPVPEYKAVVEAHGLARVARGFGVEAEVLPPLPDPDAASSCSSNPTA